MKRRHRMQVWADERIRPIGRLLREHQVGMVLVPPEAGSPQRSNRVEYLSADILRSFLAAVAHSRESGHTIQMTLDMGSSPAVPAADREAAP